MKARVMLLGAGARTENHLAAAARLEAARRFAFIGELAGTAVASADDGIAVARPRAEPSFEYDTCHVAATNSRNWRISQAWERRPPSWLLHTADPSMICFNRRCPVPDNEQENPVHH